MTLANTYQELFEILSFMDKLTVMKIPSDILESIANQRNKDFQTKIDPTDIFNENNISSETIDLLCYLDYHYFMDENKRAEIDIIKNELHLESEAQKREKYNPDNLFSDTKKETVSTIEQVPTFDSNDSALIEYKESIFTKFKNFLLNIFKRNNY